MGNLFRRLTYIRATGVQFLYRYVSEPCHAWPLGRNYSPREQAGSGRSVESSGEDITSRSACPIAIGSGSSGSAGDRREDQASRLSLWFGVNHRHFESVWQRSGL